MSKASELKRALIEAVGANPNLPINAKVVSIEDNTCSVELAGGLVISDVRLTATINSDSNSFLIVPKTQTDVLIMSQTGKLDGLFILKVDVIETIKYKNADLEFEIDGATGKVTLKKANANLGGLINNLIDTIIGAQITTISGGPGTIAPATVTQLQQIKTGFNLILNSN